MALKSPELNDVDEEWLTWIGRCVCIKGIKYGTLYFYGQTQFAEGKWCGVELNEPIGKNDGAVAGVRYFCCKPHHGIFAPASKVEKVTSPILDSARKSQVPLPKTIYQENHVPKDESYPDLDESKIPSRSSRSRSVNYASGIPHRSYLSRRREKEIAKVHHPQQGNFTNSTSKQLIGGHFSFEEEPHRTIPELASNLSSTFSSMFLSYDLNLTTYENNIKIFDKLVQDLSVDILEITENSTVIEDIEISFLRSKSCDNIPTHAETLDVLDSQSHCRNDKFMEPILHSKNEAFMTYHQEFCHNLPYCESEVNSNILFPLPKNLFPEEVNLLGSELETIGETNEKEITKTLNSQLANRTISESYQLNKYYRMNPSLCRFVSLPILEFDSSAILNKSVRTSLTRTFSAPSLFYWIYREEGTKIEDLNASIYDSLEMANLNSSFRRECSEDEEKMTSSKERPASTYTVSSTDTGYQEELGGLTEDSTPVDGPELPFGRLADDLSRRLATRAGEFFQGMNDSGGFSMIEGERETERAPCPLSVEPEATNGVQEETTVGSASPQSTVSTTLTLEDVREAGHKEPPQQQTKGPSTQQRPLKDANKPRPPTTRVTARPLPATAARQSGSSAAPNRPRQPCKEEGDGKENKPLTTSRWNRGTSHRHSAVTSRNRIPQQELFSEKEIAPMAPDTCKRPTPPVSANKQTGLWHTRSQKAAEDPKLARLKPTGPPPAPRGSLVKSRDVRPQPTTVPRPRPAVSTKIEIPEDVKPRNWRMARGTPAAPVPARTRPAPRPASRPAIPASRTTVSTPKLAAPVTKSVVPTPRIPASKPAAPSQRLTSMAPRTKPTALPVRPSGPAKPTIAAKPASTQAKPAPRGRAAVTITDYKRPPLWMSKADLSREIQHLEAQCEARTKQLRVVKSQLQQATQGFDAFAVLINYLTDDLDAFSNPRLLRDIQEAQQKLLASNLQIAYHKKELEELSRKNEGELQNVNQMLDLAHRNEIKTIRERYTEQMKSMQEQHDSEIAALKEKQKTILQESDIRFQNIIDQLNREHQDSMEKLEQSHQDTLENASRSYQQRQQELQEQLEEVQKQYDSLHSQVQKTEQVLQKGIDSKIQVNACSPWINAKRTDLEQEVESLQSVLEMKQSEIFRLRGENNEMRKELEDLPILKEKIKKLKAREEDLMALVDEKTKLQRQMSQEHNETLDSFKREAQVSKKLSRENEELQWKLRCLGNSLLSSPTHPVTLQKSSFTRDDNNSMDVFVSQGEGLEEDPGLCHVSWTIPAAAEPPGPAKVKKRSHSFSGQTATQRLYHARYKCRVSSPEPTSPLQSIAEDGSTPRESSPSTSSSGEDSLPSSRESPQEGPACFCRGVGSPRSQAGEAMVQQDETSLSLSHLVMSEDTSGRQQAPTRAACHQRLERLYMEETSSLDLAMTNSTDTDISWDDDRADV